MLDKHKIKALLINLVDEHIIDNLQKAEIKVLLNCLVDEHIDETDSAVDGLEHELPE